MKDALSAGVGGVITAVLIWALIYFFGWFKTSTIPSGAVVGFISDSCPRPGWEAWEEASGRFLRGVDWNENGLDPDGKRAPGSIQNEAVGPHDTYYPNLYTRTPSAKVHSSYGAIPFQDFTNRDDADGKIKMGTPQQDWQEYNNTLGEESRPDNVAILFCRKL